MKFCTGVARDTTVSDFMSNVVINVIEGVNCCRFVYIHAVQLRLCFFFGVSDVE